MGTASAIVLRRASQTPPPVPGSNDTAPASTQAPLSAPPAQAAPQPPAAAGSASFGFDPATLTQAPGSTFAVNVMLKGAQNIYSVPLQVSYDPNVLQVMNVSNGGLLSQDGQPVALAHRDDPRARSRSMRRGRRERRAFPDRAR